MQVVMNRSIAGCLFSFCILLIFFSSCKKFTEVDFPMTSSNGSVVYNTDAQAIGVLTGMYAKLETSPLSTGNLLAIPLFTGLSADELSLFDLNSISLQPYYFNGLTSQSSPTFWIQIYPVIFVANSAIEGLSSSTQLTPSVKQQLLGEAKFMRAYCYLNLVNLYGNIPLASSTDIKVNSSLRRANKNDVYQQIISDLKDAQTLLSSDYLNGSLQSYSGVPEKVRPTKWAATALLARSYLYSEEWSNAESEASTIISNTSYSLDTLNGVFLKNSKEAIWQLQPVRDGNFANTPEGSYFVLPSTGPSSGSYPVYLSKAIVNSFESSDKRRVKWVDSVTVSIAGTSTKFYFPAKYKIGQIAKPVNEYSMILRLAEQYLIRAEARAQQNNLNGAITDLNTIRTRAGLIGLNSNDKGTILASILQERKTELFTEWGHRWFDLKRTGNVDAVMSSITPTKGGIWATTDQLYPIPQTELDKAPSLDQNPGYN